MPSRWRERLTNPAVAIAAAVVVGKLAGYGFERLLASGYGTGPQADAFIVARHLPLRVGFVANWIVCTAFVPAFSELLVKDEAASRALLRRTAAWVGGVLLGATLLLALLARQWIGLLGHGFSPRTADLAVRLLRASSLVAVFLGLAGLFQAANAARGREGFSATGHPLAGTVTLGLALLLVGRIGVAGLALALVAGALARLASQFAVTAVDGLGGGREDLDGRLAAIGRASAALLGVIALRESLSILRMWMGSNWTGAVAAYNFADIVVLTPLLLQEALVMFYIFPRMARAWAEEGGERIWQVTAVAVRLTIFLLIPAAVGLLALAEPVVGVLFERGMFGQAAKDVTALTVRVLSLSAILVGVDAILLRSCLLARRLGTYASVMVLQIASAAVLNWVLARCWVPSAGLALSTTISTGVFTLVLLAIFRRYSKVLLCMDLARFAGKVALMSAAMGAGVYFMWRWLEGWLRPSGDAAEAVVLIACAVFGCGMYVALALSFGLREAKAVAGILAGRLGIGVRGG